MSPVADTAPMVMEWKIKWVAVKNPPANAGDTGDAGLIPVSRRSPGGRNGNPLQYSCQENPVDRGAWWNTVHEVAESGMTEVTEHTAQRVLVMVIYGLHFCCSNENSRLGFGPIQKGELNLHVMLGFSKGDNSVKMERKKKSATFFSFGFRME